MKHYLLLFAALLPAFAKAQSNYKPGYIVTLKGDTVKGYIDYREWDKNPWQVYFRDNAGTINTISILNAKAFAVSGLEYYENHIVKVSQDEIDVNKLSAQPDTSKRVDTVFLRVITKGKFLTLYSYQDAMKLRYYLLQQGNARPRELEFHAYYNPDVSASVRYVNRYRVQLQFAAQQAGAASREIEQLIQRAGYNGDITNVVSKINGSSSLPAGSRKANGLRWFAGAAILDNTLKTEDVIAAPPSHSILPKISGGIDFLPNKNVQQLILRGELSLTAGHYSFANPSAYPPFKGAFDQYTLSVNPQFLFNFYNTDNLKLFIDGGISFNISQYSNYYIGFTDIKYNNYPPLAKLWVSIPLKFGVAINRKVEVYAGYTPLTNLTTVSDFPVTLTTYQAGINYLFGAR
ncbi:MAG: hypothetical protein JST32_01880 [Bacteroidetes bacterium]|nr:hypothetical protein [Bacteroidota bacterium]